MRWVRPRSLLSIAAVLLVIALLSRALLDDVIVRLDESFTPTTSLAQGTIFVITESVSSASLAVGTAALAAALVLYVQGIESVTGADRSTMSDVDSVLSRGSPPSWEHPGIVNLRTTVAGRGGLVVTANRVDRYESGAVVTLGVHSIAPLRRPGSQLDDLLSAAIGDNGEDKGLMVRFAHVRPGRTSEITVAAGSIPANHQVTPSPNAEVLSLYTHPHLWTISFWVTELCGEDVGIEVRWPSGGIEPQWLRLPAATMEGALRDVEHVDDVSQT